MKLSETFNSIQGEGPLQGRPAFFIRLAGCNLKCDFCDTPYAQKPDGPECDITQVRDAMVEMTQRYGRDYPFVITGGEPLMQQEAIETLLGSFFARAAKRANVWFETNGTVMPSKSLVVKYHPKFVVSPKSGYVRPDVLKALSQLDTHFKFVIGKGSWNVDGALMVAAEWDVPRERVWLQPLGTKALDVTRAGRLLWLECENHGVGFSPRLQTLLFGAKRGV
jgi:7-carboxy-7-deazaguanine synthase